MVCFEDPFELRWSSWSACSRHAGATTSGLLFTIRLRMSSSFLIFSFFQDGGFACSWPRFAGVSYGECILGTSRPCTTKYDVCDEPLQQRHEELDKASNFCCFRKFWAWHSEIYVFLILRQFLLSSFLLSSSPSGRKSINEIMPMIGARFYSQLETAQMRNDMLENELSKVAYYFFFSVWFLCTFSQAIN